MWKLMKWRHSTTSAHTITHPKQASIPCTAQENSWTHLRRTTTNVQYSKHIMLTIISNSNMQTTGFGHFSCIVVHRNPETMSKQNSIEIDVHIPYLLSFQSGLWRHGDEGPKFMSNWAPLDLLLCGNSQHKQLDENYSREFCNESKSNMQLQL